MVSDIKDRISLIDIFDLLGVKFKGKQAVCPFHLDKRPSLSFKPSGLWYCFVCNVGGDQINFVMRHESLEFKDALDWLNDKFSLGLSNKKPKRNYYTEALNENYRSLKKCLHDEIDKIINRYHEIKNYPAYWIDAKDHTFLYTYHETLNHLEAKLRELENARFKLRRTAA